MKNPRQIQHFSVDHENKPKKEGKEKKHFLFQLLAILRFDEFPDLSKEQRLT